MVDYKFRWNIMMKFFVFLYCLFNFLGCVKEPNFTPPVSRPSSIKFKKMGGDFKLRVYKNKKERYWALSESKGKVRILYFGFTFCPDICPVSLTKLTKLLKNFSEENQLLIQPVFISVDYQRDNAQKVDRYSKYYSSKMIGLSGSKEEIEKVAKQYGAYFKISKQADSALKFTVDHTSRYFLVDKKGELFNSYSTTDASFVSDLKKLIRMDK